MGFRRVKRGKGFRYLDESGCPVRDEATLARIRSLAIPPAWREVWICRHAHGHLQATGRDSRGRKQYRYHPRWREVRDDNKFSRLLAFGRALPRIRRRVRRDLRRAGMSKDKVLAAVVRLLDATSIRIGNEEYARTNGSFGLTTLRDHHVRCGSNGVHMRFRAKSGKTHEVHVKDRRLARIVRRCRDLPGQLLFQYLDASHRPCSISSTDVNRYVKQVTNEEFTAKDFRTWTATVVAAEQILSDPDPTASRKRLASALEQVAAALGNTPAICRKCYVHPAVIEFLLTGGVRNEFMRRKRSQKDLSNTESVVLTLLQSVRLRP